VKWQPCSTTTGARRQTTFGVRANLNPGTNVRLQHLLWYLLPQGRTAESHEVMSQDPLFPLAHISKTNAAIFAQRLEKVKLARLTAFSQTQDSEKHRRDTRKPLNAQVFHSHK
jgi:hypothetical protein